MEADDEPESSGKGKGKGRERWGEDGTDGLHAYRDIPF